MHRITCAILAVFISGCVSTEVKVEKQFIDSIDGLNRELQFHRDPMTFEKTSFEMSGFCQVRMVTDWPKKAAEYQGYTTAKTLSFINFDGGIKSIEYSPEPAEIFKGRLGYQNTFILISFNWLEKYITKATLTSTGANNEIVGYVDAVRIDLSHENDKSTADRIINRLHNLQKICSLHPASNANQASTEPNPINVLEQVALANAYNSRNGIFKNKTLAAFWYEKAAIQGNASAQTHLGNSYRSGIGVKIDLEKARIWFEVAAEQGAPLALDFLGEIYEKGKGVTPDPKKAAMYYQRAALLNVETAQESLAQMLHFGKGITKDLSEAAYWYRKAANQGSALAKNNLADMYEKGDGVKQDYAQAFDLYHEVAKTGLDAALYSLAELYRAGKGRNVDMKMAYTFYQLSRKSGDENIPKRDDEFTKTLLPIDIKMSNTFVAQWTPSMPLPDEH